MENDVLYNRIMNVIHEEYGEGSTAVANPEGEPAGDLSSIQIGNEIYGISGGADRFFEVHFDGETGTLDKTWQEIFDAIGDGKIPFYIEYVDGSDFQYAAFNRCDVAILEENAFDVYFYCITWYSGRSTVEMKPFTTNSANGYPVIED